jgi:hypothetical protein
LEGQEKVGNVEFMVQGGVGRGGFVGIPAIPQGKPGGTSGCDREPTGYSTARGGQATHWSCCLSEHLEC